MRALSRIVGSVRGRITLISTAVVAITLTLASILLIRLVEADLLATARDAVDDALAEQAELLGVDPDFLPAQFISFEVDGELFELGLFTIEEDDGLAVGSLYIEDEEVATLFLDPETGEIEEIFDPFTGFPLDDPELEDELSSLLFETSLLDGAGDDAQLLVGATGLDEVEDSIRALRNGLLTIVPLLVLALGLLIWWLVGRALRPVMAITAQVQDISTTNLHRRVPVPSSRDEVADLAQVMNGMLARLERGDQRQRQFSADASHELRSPLSSVKAAAEILGRGTNPARTAALADDIAAEADRMDELIGDLLELSRLEERGTAAFEEVDLVPLVATELADDRVELRLPDQAPLQGAPRQLRRLVRNLVDNATRHAEERVAVTVNRHVTTTGAAVVLSVDDDGSGVPEDSRTVIFERFSRLDEARTREGGGSGLGLALVASIVDNHGGSIAVGQSDLGGARFVATLPSGPAMAVD